MLKFILKWIAGTFLGLISVPVVVVFAAAASELFYTSTITGISQPVSNLFSFIVIFSSIFLIGVSVSVTQWFVTLRELIRIRTWLLISITATISGSIGLLIGTQISPPFVLSQPGILSGMDDRFVLSESWLLAVIILSISWGTASGIPQWIVLRRQFQHAVTWLFAVILGYMGIFVSITALVVIVKGTVLVGTLSCCISPIAFGAITGGAFYGLVKRPKPAES